LGVRRHCQLRNAIAEPAVEQAHWPGAPLRHAATPCSVIKRREEKPWA
jgi:hypothetical protein